MFIPFLHHNSRLSDKTLTIFGKTFILAKNYVKYQKLWHSTYLRRQVGVGGEYGGLAGTHGGTDGVTAPEALLLPLLVLAEGTADEDEDEEQDGAGDRQRNDDWPPVHLRLHVWRCGEQTQD